MTILGPKLLDTVTLWRSTGTTVAGDSTFDAPVQLKGRWLEKTEIFVDRGGNERRSNITIFLDEDVTLADWMALGTHTDADPRLNVAARQVRDFRKISNLQVTEYVRKALL